MKKPPEPEHVPGTRKGEEYALTSHEPGRGVGKSYRAARDSTGVNPEGHKPIHRAMIDIRPA